MELKSALGTDGWSYKPALLCLMAVAALELVCRLPGTASFLLIPISLLGYGIAVVVVLVLAAYCFIKKRLRKGASVLLVLLLPALLWRPIGWAADVVHLELTTGFGAGQLGAPFRSSDGKFTAYDWSVGLAGANTFLIHDVTGEIALPLSQHTHAPSLDNGFEKECAGRVRRLVSHYFVCSF